VLDDADAEVAVLDRAGKSPSGDLVKAGWHNQNAYASGRRPSFPPGLELNRTVASLVLLLYTKKD